MKTFVSFVTFAILVFVGAAHAETVLPKCELEMSSHVRVLVRLIELGLEDQILTSDDVKKLISTKKWYNPFALYSKKPHSLALRSAFAGASRDLARQEIALIHKTLTEKLDKLSIQTTQVSETRDFTSHLVLPKVLGKIDLGHYTTSDQLFGAGTLDGRPIFLGRFVQTQGGMTSVVLDPFHSDRDKRVASIENSVTNDDVGSIPEFFELDGVPHAMVFGDDLHVNLQTMRNESSTRFASFHNSEFTRHSDTILVKGEGYVKVIGTSVAPSLEDKLVEFDLLNPGTPRVLAEDVKSSSHPPRVDYIKNKPYVSYYGRDKLYVYDVANEKMFAPINCALGGRGSSNYAAVFEDRGQLYVTCMHFEVRDESYSVRTINLKTRKVEVARRKFDWPSAMNLMRIDGVPYLYFLDEGYVYTLNLRTRGSKRAPVPPENMAVNFTHFELRGTPYLLYGSGDGTLNIFDFRDQRLVFSQNILPIRSKQILPFTHDGAIYAFVSVDHESPILVQLTQPSPVAP